MAEDQSGTGKDNPTPRPSMADFWRRMNERSTINPPQVIGGEEASTEEPTKEQEMTQYSVRQLAKMANEIKDIAEQGGAKSDINDEFYVNVIQRPLDRGTIAISFFTNDIKKPDGKNASISFRYKLNGDTDYGKRLGTRGNFELIVGVHNDEKSREAYDEYVKTNPALAGAAYTRYYFDEDGNFAKVLGLPRYMSNSRPLLNPPAKFIKSVEGEMTPSDFELAGKALSLILEKIRPQVSHT